MSRKEPIQWKIETNQNINSSLPHQVILQEGVPQLQEANATWRPMTEMQGSHGLSAGSTSGGNSMGMPP
jgi:hypothetical protein